MATLQAIRYEKGTDGKPAKLSILDQLLLPHKSTYIDIANVDEGWQCVKKMQVRGAPALAIVSMLSLAVELQDAGSALAQETDSAKLSALISEKIEYLKTSRPTAVNLAEAADRLWNHMSTEWALLNADDKRRRLIEEIEQMLPIDITTNKNIGSHGGDFLLSQALSNPAAADAIRAADSLGKPSLRIITHCNTGSLATAQYGTALGVARWLNDNKLLDTLFCTETRPYNQGARLTAYECVVDQIPYCLVTDSMVAALMSSRRIDAVVVGADRVVANGDTANKIGTYQLAILAKHFGVKFYVAAPHTSLDPSIATGSDIVIEQRPPQEFTATARAPENATVWNPSFDVTPAALIDAIFTEHGVITKPVATDTAPNSGAVFLYQTLQFRLLWVVCFAFDNVGLSVWCRCI